MEWHSTKFTNKINLETFDFLCWIVLCSLEQITGKFVLNRLFCSELLLHESLNPSHFCLFGVGLTHWCPGTHTFLGPNQGVLWSLTVHTKRGQWKSFPPGAGCYLQNKSQCWALKAAGPQRSPPSLALNLKKSEFKSLEVCYIITECLIV